MKKEYMYDGKMIGIWYISEKEVTKQTTFLFYAWTLFHDEQGKRYMQAM